MDEVSLDLIPTCVYVRHKLMYVDHLHATPGLVDDSSDTRVFWCIKTMEPLGPDHRPVNPRACCSSRPCYCGRGEHAAFAHGGRRGASADSA